MEDRITDDMTRALTESEIQALLDIADEAFDADLAELAELEFIADYGLENDDYDD